MAKTRPFSRHTGGPLSNFTEQVGNLYFGNDNTLFEVGGLKWWNGPDEDNGYVIAFEDAQGSHTGADGEPAFLGFKRSSQKTEASFLLLTRKVTGQTFTTGAEAKAYLNANGMWTSYGLETIEPTATPEPTATEVAPTATQSPVPTSTPLAIQLIQRITSSLYTDVNAQGKSAAQLNAYLCQGIPYSWSSNTLYTSGNATPQDGDVIVYSNGLPFSNQQRLVVVGYTGTVTNWYRVATDINGVATVTQMSPCATATPEPTATEVAPTATPEPTLEPTATEVAPTATPEPTATEVAPTATPEPTATEVAPTATPEPTATATPASGFTVTIDEVGSDVVMTATGSLNIDGLTLVESNVGPFSGAGFGVSTATYVLGTTPINYDSYTGFDTYPTSFGSYGGLPPESSTGDIFGVIMQGAPPYMLIVPVGYQSGDQISTSQTFENKTLSSLGLTSGTYTYTWGTGANAETFNVVIGSGAGNGGGGTPTTIDETLYWSYGNPFNISLTYNAATTGGNGVGMVNGFYLNKLSSDIDGNLVGDQSSFLMNLPAGTLISYSNTVNPSVYNGIYEVVSVSDMTNTVLVNVTFVSTTYQFGSLQNGIAEFHFYSPNNSGSGEWYFYSSDDGPINATPPTQDGNAIFLVRDNQNGTLNETFNPNKVGGANEIYFNLSDSTGTDYTTQFTNLQTNGGSITITQGANSVTYTSTTPGVFFADVQVGFFFIQAGQATQTLTSASPFVYGDPISIAFN